jgi:uncharacterized membrane protein YvlD (DUF360 family)
VVPVPVTIDARPPGRIALWAAPGVPSWLPMVILGGLAGGIVGFLIGLLITEVIVGNSANSSGFDWQFWTDVVLAIVGVVAGSSLARHFVARRTRAT